MAPSARALVLAAALAGAPAAAVAGPQLSDQVGDLDARIAEDPRDATLRVERARVQLLRGEVDAALADLEAADALDPDLAAIHLERGRAFAAAGLPAAARAAMDRYVAARPRDAAVRVERARVLAELGDLEAAERDYDVAVARAPRPAPELWIERAHVTARRGPAHVDRALAGLDAGVDRLGPVVTLLAAAADLARDAGRPEEALRRLDALGRVVPPSLARRLDRAEMLVAAGRGDEGEAVARSVLSALPTSTARERGGASAETLEERASGLLSARSRGAAATSSSSPASP